MVFTVLTEYWTSDVQYSVKTFYTEDIFVLE